MRLSKGKREEKLIRRVKERKLKNRTGIKNIDKEEKNPENEIEKTYQKPINQNEIR